MRTEPAMKRYNLFLTQNQIQALQVRGQMTETSVSEQIRQAINNLLSSGQRNAKREEPAE